MKQYNKLMPRTFVMESDDFQTLYLPNRPSGRKNGDRVSCCVYACSQFMEYAVDRWGRRIIPMGAKCPYQVLYHGGHPVCDGQRVCHNGEIVGTVRRYESVRRIGVSLRDQMAIRQDFFELNNQKIR